ncbi:MAG: M20/M25/M40 family metallo-hydrolase [Caldilineaceae bacterium]|nr:M20/M25/M40 family metallo-hydrolase [Caldilineaceae bacterium]
MRLVVVGAVEEEAATSKGARFIRDRFDGVREPIPHACIIGEPSGVNRVTLGYKGRLLVELEAWQPMMHTAGPDAGIATVAVDFWNWLSAYAADFNSEHDRTFDQLSPSLRHIHTDTDEAMQDRVTAQAGIRLPLEFDATAFADELLQWARRRVGANAETSGETNLPISNLPSTPILTEGPTSSLTLTFRGYEQAWRSDRNNALVRSFLGAIRHVQNGERPGFVVKTGTSDMNVVGPAWQCPLLAYGPGDSSLDHTPHEHLLLDEYWQAVLVLEQALRNLPPLLG